MVSNNGPHRVTSYGCLFNEPTDKCEKCDKRPTQHRYGGGYCEKHAAVALVIGALTNNND